MSNPTPRKGCRIIYMTQTRCQRSKTESIVSASLRCSRPLCSSQNTGGTLRSRPEGQPQQGPEAVTAPGGAGRSLRTQQRAKDQTRTEHPFQHRKRCVLGGKILTWPQCQCSTHERHRRTYVSDMATRCTSPVYRGILECSLERR